MNVGRLLGRLQGEGRVLSALIDKLIAGDPGGPLEIRQALDEFEVSKGVVERELISRLRDVRRAADALIEPLRQLCADNPHLRIVILVDGLDEIAQTSGLVQPNLLSLIERLPEQVRFVLLSRPLPEIINTLGPPQVDLDEEAPAGENDILAYALERLASLPEHERRKAAEQIARRSGGSFVVACAALDKVPPYG